MDGPPGRVDRELTLNHPASNIAGSTSSSSVSSPSSKVLIQIVIPDHEWKFVFRTPTNTLVRELLRRVFDICRLDLVQYINYGFFLPPNGVQKGKFLQEERLLTEYPQLIASATEVCKNGIDSESHENGMDKAATLMLIRRCRFVDGLPMNENRFKQVNSKAQQKQFLSAVRTHNLHRITCMLDRGLDPNFQCPCTGDTPLCCAVSLPFPREVILKLVEKGAHLEFRDAETLTPLHRAAVEGRPEAIRVLLNLGVNPNVRDCRELTPLYHAVSLDVPVECISILLYDHAILGVTDDKNRQEIHQACLFDKPAHLEQLILYGADLNAQTANLDTPLHICALNNHETCLRLLLRYGANRAHMNASGQTPSEVALLTGLNQLAELIDNFDPALISPVERSPTYNADRRPSVSGPRAALEAQRKYDAPSTHSQSLGRSDYKAPNTISLGGLNTWNSETPKFDRKMKLPSAPEIRCEGQNIVGSSKLLRSETLNPIGHSRFTPGRQLQTTSVVTLHRGNTGFGFQIRGRGTTGEVGPVAFNVVQPPANQLLDRIFPNSPAAAAGLSPGQYILEVNGIDVRRAPHHMVTDLIVQSGDRVTLKVLHGNHLQGRHARNCVNMADRRNSFRRPESAVPCYRSLSIRPIASCAHRSLSSSRSFEKVIDTGKSIAFGDSQDRHTTMSCAEVRKPLHIHRLPSGYHSVSEEEEKCSGNHRATPVPANKSNSNFKARVVLIRTQQSSSEKANDQKLVLGGQQESSSVIRSTSKAQMGLSIPH